MQKIIECENIVEETRKQATEIGADRAYIVTDSGVAEKQGALLSQLANALRANVFVMPQGEENKNLTTLTRLWEWLSEEGATRESVVINFGGGVVSDLGGFAAGSFKRGISFLNIPTTVLGAADAAVGGKTGIDFNGLKNEIGAFAPAKAVIISPLPLATLPSSLIADGMAEVVKMALLTDERWWEEATHPDYYTDKESVARSMTRAARAKMEIVEADPKEGSLRRVLNLGHTFAHAFESIAMERGAALSHGSAVAHGLLYALRLSEKYLDADPNLPIEYEHKILRPNYLPLPFDVESQIDRIEYFLTHDKKNIADGRVRFVLMERVGLPRLMSLTTQEWKWAVTRSR